MEHKITALIDLKIQSLRHALFRHYAIETENYTNAMYYQLLFLDAATSYLDIKKNLNRYEYNEFIYAINCIDYTNLDYR
jgi:hypothetical protein